MIVEVQCYAGRKGEERPVRFRIGEHDHMVEEIIEQWYGPDASFYKIRADDDRSYLLRHQTANDRWVVEPIQKILPRQSI
jgi:hypothetical protein